MTGQIATRPSTATAPTCAGSGQHVDMPGATSFAATSCTTCGRQVGIRDGVVVRHDVSVFAGRWLIPGHDYRPARAYPGVMAGSRHQFRVTPEIAAAIVADHEELDWDGAVIVVGSELRVAPGFDGSYLIGWGWAWDRYPAAEVLAVAA